MTVNRPFQCSRRNGDSGSALAATERIPRVSRLMALAIYFDQLIRDRVVADQAELARLGHVSRARLSQIMDLLCLAPDIQTRVLDANGSSSVTERALRSIVAEPDWSKQRRKWGSREL